MVISINRKLGLAEKPVLELVSNPGIKPSELKYMIENTKAVYEIRRIMVGTPYTMNDVWQDINHELLHQETGQETT